MYFAPLVGAVKGVGAEYRRLELDRQRRATSDNIVLRPNHHSPKKE